MKTRIALLVMAFICTGWAAAQKNCSSYAYNQLAVQQNPALRDSWNTIESFTSEYINRLTRENARPLQGTVIKVPVVVHILYHYPAENISDELVKSQIEILNKSFRRTNADTILTPLAFAGLAADCEIEFQLAVSNPRRANTSGIIRKYTPVKAWQDDDAMKFSASMGDDAWDSKSYLNIWVCNMQRVAGYASLPGGDPKTDGIVLSTSVVGQGGRTGFNLGKTAVHEAGHWLNLRHLWGDEYCGDDFVGDTPRQGGYTAGCPTGIQTSCSNGPTGDMYMNYMDFTDDACMNLFTSGQKMRMRALFENGGPRHGILSSTGLMPPLIFESPIPEEAPRWLQAQLYPNPATGDLKLDLSYDVRWIGKTLSVVDMRGQSVMQVLVTSKLQVIPAAALQAGMYIISGRKEDGEVIRQKFIKL